MEKVAVIAIMVDQSITGVSDVNLLLSKYYAQIHGRMGIPRMKDEKCVISLIVKMDSDELGALTGKLGQMRGVTVKSMALA